MTKRFKLYDEETLDTHIEDTEDCYGDGTPKSYWFGENEDFCNLFYKLNELSDENEQLKQSVNNLKDTIVTIGIAYQRKYDRTLVDLVDEVHDEDITDLIKELQE